MYKKTLLAALLATSAAASHAFIVYAPTNLGGPYLDLQNLTGGTTLTGGALFTTDQGNADIPTNVANDWQTVGAFLAVGPSHGATATLTFGTALSNVSFLWGSPDVRNQLTIVTNYHSYVLDANDWPLAILPTPEGDQSAAQYVSFQGYGGEQILSLSFTNTSAQDAFEVSNFSVTAVPEPETYALMMAGLLAVGYMSRRRQN